MKRFILFILLALASLSLLAQSANMVDPYTEIRYCGPPKRNPITGEILRDSKVISEYRKIHKCPSTGLYKGACPNYSLNHGTPLACGGCDAVWNLFWMRNDIKALQDRVERRIYALDPPIEDTAACKFQITP